MPRVLRKPISKWFRFKLWLEDLFFHFGSLMSYLYPRPLQPAMLTPEEVEEANRLEDPTRVAMIGIAAQIEQDMFFPELSYPGKGKDYGSYWYNAATDEISWAILHCTFLEVGEITNDRWVFLGNVKGDFDEIV